MALISVSYVRKEEISGGRSMQAPEAPNATDLIQITTDTLAQLRT